MKKQFPIFLVALVVSLSAFWMLYHKKDSNVSLSHDCAIEMSQSDKNKIIEQALNIELPLADAIGSEEANQLREQAYNKVYECKYEEAIAIVLAGLKKFPKNFSLQSDLAALVGDYSEVTPAPLKDRMIQWSKIMFDRLLKEIDAQPKEVFYPFKNEYCYRFALYREQYEFGLMRVEDYWGTDEWVERGFKGYYSQGVGAANYARELVRQRNKLLALDYAHKAVVAWAQYFSYKNDYYNSYVHYALALGILGYKEEMMRALRRSASLINRDLSYHEFKEVTDFIEELEQKN